MREWGLKEALDPLAVTPEAFDVHRYSDGVVLGKSPDYGPEMTRRFQAPYWNCHRVDVQTAMFDRCKELGVEFRFNARVGEYDLEAPVAILPDGEVIPADIIIAADGLWSRARNHFLGKDVSPKPTGDLAYRIVLERDQITDPDLLRFVEKPQVHLWAGPGCHVMFYCIRKTMFNLVLLVPDNLPENVAKAPGDLSEMRELFKGWDPVLTKFLSLVQKVDKWRLMHLTEMASWSNASTNSTLVFLGDACHPMLPYLAQGANSSVEDGAVLGILLSKIRDVGPGRKNVSDVFNLYQQVRKDRSEKVAAASRQQRHTNHLPDGPEQEARDKLMLEQFDEQKPGYPFFWAEPVVQKWIFGYDAIYEAEHAWINRTKNALR